MFATFWTLLVSFHAVPCTVPADGDDPPRTTGQLSSAAPGTLFLHPERLRLTDGSVVTIERGMLFAPLVRSDPDSAVIGVDVVRFRAQEGADPATPPIFRLHGGPGWPGYDDEQLASPGFHSNTVWPMTRHADFVVIGQRGIGTSKPNTLCEGVPEAPSGTERTPEEAAAALQDACRSCKVFWESQGYDLRGFNVIEAAADVDDVRRLLGYEQVTLWGGSFGSHWGMAVLRYHPEGVARAVLTGMEGPDHTYDMPAGVLAALERIAGEAEIAPSLIDHVPDDGILGAFEAAIVRAEEEPIEVQVRHPDTGRDETVVLTADDLRGLAKGVSASTGSRRRMGGWAADLIALGRGDFEEAALRRLGGDDGGLPTASFFNLDCGSGISPARAAELEADPAARIVGDLGRFYRTACAAWDADLGEDFREGFVTDVPTLIVQGTWDTSTPFENALELLDSFRNGHFVIVDGGSHGALDEALDYSDAFASEVMEFVTTGDLEGLPDEVRMPPMAWEVPR